MPLLPIPLPLASPFSQHCPAHHSLYVPRPPNTAFNNAEGFGSPDVTVLPTAFEHGGCFHNYPTLGEMQGLEFLESAVSASKSTMHLKTETHYPGLSTAQVLDPDYVTAYLGLQQQTNIFCDAEHGMDKGWWAEQGTGSVETRKGCFNRGAALAARFVEMAATDEKDVVVCVSHGDLMDCILKSLLMPGLDAKVQDAACRFVHANTGITRVEISRDGTAFLLTHNSTSHIDTDTKLLTGGELVHDWDCWDKHHESATAEQGH